MMKRLFSMLYNRTSGVNEAAFLLGIFTFCSQILGLIRDRLLATYVGAGPELDVYYTAFKIPDLLYVTVGTLASITVLLPLLTRKHQQGLQYFKQSINQLFTVLVFFLIGISIILFILMPFLVPYIAPGFSTNQQNTVTVLARIMLLQPIFIGISGMISSVTQFFKKFLITALTPLMYNLGIIIGIIFFYPIFGVEGLAVGVVFGALLHLGIQIPLMIYEKTLPCVTFQIDWTEIRDLVKLSIPRTIGLSMSSVTVIFLISLASKLNTGSIALFTLTQNILNVPLAIIGVSYSVASFPILVKYYSEADFHAFIDRILQGVQKIIFLSLPATVLFIVLRAQIVRVVLGTHSFSWNDTRIAAAILGVFMVGLVGQSLVQMLVRGMYAMGETRKPLTAMILSQIFVIILALIFLRIFTLPTIVEVVQYVLRLQDINDVRILALPFAFALGNIVNSLLLGIFLVKKFPFTPLKKLFISIGQTSIASLVIGVVAYVTLYIGSLVLNQESFLGIFIQGSIAGIVGIMAGIVILKILNNQDINEFQRTLKKKFWKVKIVQDISITP